MKYETPIMEIVIMAKRDVITLSVETEGSGTVINPFASSTPEITW